MGNFATSAITENGRALLADLQAGAVFVPTKIVIGSGYMPSDAAASTMTDVVNPIKELTINKKKRTPDGKCIIGGAYSNEDVSEDFYLRELALYAKAEYRSEDGTITSEVAECLYSYGYAGDSADLIPVASSQVVEKQIDLVVWVGSDAQVDLSIDSGVNATRAYVNDQLTAVTTEGTSTAYTAKVDGITELKAGLVIRVIPHVDADMSADSITLDVNGLGALTVGRRVAGAPSAGAIKLMSCVGATGTGMPLFCARCVLTLVCEADASGELNWVLSDYPHYIRPDISSPVSISQGGTGASNAKDALRYLGAAQIAAGSYVGTGSYGESNPCTLTFDFRPKFVMVYTENMGFLSGDYDGSRPSCTLMAAYGATEANRFSMINATSGGRIIDYYEWGDTSFSWYSYINSSDRDGTVQLNAEGTTYYYLAIG